MVKAIKSSKDDYSTLSEGFFSLHTSNSNRGRIRSMVKFASLSVFCALGVYLTSGAVVKSSGDVTTNVPKSLWTNWAMYSPYFPSGEYEKAPLGCTVDQVNILQRHGARYPTASAGKQIAAAIAKLTAAKTYNDPSLAFLKSYTYQLSSDVLVPFGAVQSWEAGQEHYNRYRYLVSKNELPFVRASSSDRVVHSATNWTAGFSLASHHVYNPSLSVVLSESANDTLDDSMCPSAGSSDDADAAWLAVFAPPITSRLNAQAPGANLTNSDVYSLMTMCAFESIYIEKESKFCNLFTQAEFKELEYYGDLDKYYNTGYGQALGPVQGVGYINELLARLTGSPVQDETQTNRTLDASSDTFPLDRTIYADFSHDNQMIAIYAAMGLFKQSEPLNTTSSTHNPTNRTWITSHLVPFSARMLVEKLSCSAREKYVRIFVNDALQPLEFCGGKKGLCTVEAFVESQSYARNNGKGDFEKCHT